MLEQAAKHLQKLAKQAANGKSLFKSLPEQRTNCEWKTLKRSFAITQIFLNQKKAEMFMQKLDYLPDQWSSL